MTIREQIGGYTTIPIQLGPNGPLHVIYVRKHQGRDQGKKDDTTVFAANLPVNTTVQHIKHLANSLGNTLVKEFRYQGSNRAQIELVDKTSCNRFLSKAKGRNAIEWPMPEENGSAYYITMNRERYLDQDELANKVDQYMEKFAKAEEKKLEEVRRLAQMVDDDGFTMVVGPKRRSAGGIAAPKVGVEVQQKKKKKKTKEKTDFYRFQLRERKKNEMNDLLRRFQNDKKKVEELRQKKRFRPY